VLLLHFITLNDTHTHTHTHTHTLGLLWTRNRFVAIFETDISLKLRPKVSHPVYSSPPRARLKLKYKIKSQFFSDSKYYSAHYH